MSCLTGIKEIFFLLYMYVEKVFIVLVECNFTIIKGGRETNSSVCNKCFKFQDLTHARKTASHPNTLSIQRYTVKPDYLKYMQKNLKMYAVSW